MNNYGDDSDKEEKIKAHNLAKSIRKISKNKVNGDDSDKEEKLRAYNLAKSIRKRSKNKVKEDTSRKFNTQFGSNDK